MNWCVSGLKSQFYQSFSFMESWGYELHSAWFSCHHIWTPKSPFRIHMVFFRIATDNMDPMKHCDPQHHHGCCGISLRSVSLGSGGFQVCTSLFQMISFWLPYSWYPWLFFSFWWAGNEGLLVDKNEQSLDFQTHSPKSLIMKRFHFSVSLMFHISGHLLPDGKAMFVPSEGCPQQSSTWLTGLLGEHRPLSVFSKN